MEKEYIKPTIKVTEIEMEAILAGSNPTSAPASTQLDDDDPVSNVADIESKRNGASLWDE